MQVTDAIARLRGLLDGASGYISYRGRAPDGVPQLRSDIETVLAELAALREQVARLTRERDEAKDCAFKAKHAAAILIDEAVYSDSYGVPGSDFACCRFCNAGGAPGVEYKHDDRCPVLRCEELAGETWDELTGLYTDLAASEKREAALKAERDEALAKMQAMRRAGAGLANLAYNLASDKSLPDRTRPSLKEGYERWDTVVSTAPSAALADLTERIRRGALKEDGQREAVLRDALEKIANHPKAYRDETESYAVGWAFHNVQRIARAAIEALADKGGKPC